MSETLHVKLSPKPLTRLFQFIKPYSGRLYLSMFWSFANKLLDLAPPVLVGWAVDTVTNQPPEFITGIAGDSAMHAGIFLGLLGVFIFGFESLFQYVAAIGFMGLAQAVQNDLRVVAYEKMQEREMAFFEDHRVGETMSMLSDDVNQLERFLNTVFNDYVQLVSLMVIAGAVLFDASPLLSVVAIAPIPIIVWGSLKFQKLLTPRYRQVRAAVGQLNTRLENNLGVIAVIKAFTAEKFEAGRLSEVSEAYRDKNVSAIRFASAFGPLIRMGVAIGFGGVLVFGTMWTIDGDITPGTFTLFTMMCQRILWPLTRLGQILDETERCRASAARVFGLLDTPSKIVDADDAFTGEITGTVELENVRFRYARGTDILRGMSFQIKEGETVGIAGATGAGKSTLIKLLLRFYDPVEGSVKIGGKDLRQVSLKTIRQHVALVSQDVYLFQGSIAENIAYGSDEVDRESIQQAAKKARLHEFIESLPDGYNTLVGERGIKLSGGQRQRLSIARALLRDAPILVLDEATSSVDTETEREIQRSLNEYTKGKTAIVIAHRLSTIRSADRILVLSDGKLQEQGNHDDLVAERGAYFDLWKLQTGAV